MVTNTRVIASCLDERAPRLEILPLTPEGLDSRASVLGLGALSEFACGTHSSASAAEVAVLSGAGIDAAAVAEDLLLGFRLGPRSIYSGICRRRAEPGRLTNVPMSLGDLCAWVGSASDHGAVLELTGGVDSRLILAMALRGGSKPRLAFTLGQTDSPDVQVANLLCSRFGIEHHVIPIDAPEESAIWPDLCDIVEKSSFVCNATSYAWLPAVFRSMAPLRNAQITGAGGEAAGDFYYSRIDSLPIAALRERLWLQFRLARPGVAISELFGRERAEAEFVDLIARVRDLLRAERCDWRVGLDRFYVEQRLENWAIPVLCASAGWYTVWAPLLTPAYALWTQSLARVDRIGRRAQRALIVGLVPEMKEFPFASEFKSTRSITSRRLRRFGRAVGRLCGRAKAPDLGAAETAAALCRCPEATFALRELLGEPSLGLKEQGIAKCLQDPRRYAHELGVLWTAACARRARESHKERGVSPIREACR